MIYVPSRMGQLNRRALLRQLQKLGVASRAELAKSLGMSQPTAGKIVDELITAEVLEEVVQQENDVAESVLRGRPGRKLRLNRSKLRLLAIQMGMRETSVACVAFGVSDEDEWHEVFSVAPDEANPVAAWERQLKAVARKIGTKGFLGVLLSVPGIVDEMQNRVMFSPNIHWTEKTDMAAIVRRVWDVPVLLVQEERALALGHHLANPQCDDFLLVDFGEGVGGAIVVEGKPLANPLPISGEIGHTPVLGNQRQCGCGAVGCMETLVSLRGLLESFAEAQKLRNPSWDDVKAYVSKHGIPSWLAQSLDAAAVAIAGALNVLGLRRAVITGSLTELPPVVMEHLSHAVQKGSMWAKFGTVDCVAAPRRRTAGLVTVGIDRLIVPDHQSKSGLMEKTLRDEGIVRKTRKQNTTNKILA
jgi:predicted NBD/HSP70 family sugar kinase